MKVLKEYEIPFVGLKEGMHNYHFRVDHEFFAQFEYSEVQQGTLSVDVNLEKRSRMMVFTFNIDGKVVVPCDRCLADMDLRLKGEQRLIVKLGHEWKEETDEILIIPDTESHIDISGFIYEYIMLLLPYQRMHPEGEGLCDETMIEKLEKHEPHREDPRWDALKELKDNKDIT